MERIYSSEIKTDICMNEYAYTWQETKAYIYLVPVAECNL